MQWVKWVIAVCAGARVTVYEGSATAGSSMICV